MYIKVNPSLGGTIKNITSQNLQICKSNSSNNKCCNLGLKLTTKVQGWNMIREANWEYVFTFKYILLSWNDARKWIPTFPNGFSFWELGKFILTHGTTKNITSQIFEIHPILRQQIIHIKKNICIYIPDYLSKGYAYYVEFKTSIKFTKKCVLMLKMNA